MITDENFRLYNCKDAYATILIAEKLKQELQEEKLDIFYNRLVQPLARVILGLNQRGLPINEPTRLEAIQDLTGQITNLELQVNHMAGEKLNINGKRLKELVYYDLKLRKLSRKGLTTDKEALIKLSETYPEYRFFFQTILKARKLQKLKSTFLEGLNPDEFGRVHPSYRIGPATGRLACKKPNFQNIPAGICRQIFQASPGNLFVYADYSQVEIRVLGVIAGANSILDIFDAGWDIHDANAREMFALAPSDIVTTKQRTVAKIFFFGHIAYGGTLEGIKSRETAILGDVPIERLREMGDRFFAKHPKVFEYRRAVENTLKTTKRLVNAFGRPRIYFGNLTEDIRSGYNFGVQSSAADLLSLGLILLDKTFPKRLVLQVHDSIMLEVPEAEAEKVLQGIKEILERPIPELANYKFPAKYKIAKSWGEC